MSDEITQGSGNVFADLGMAGAAERPFLRPPEELVAALLHMFIERYGHGGL